MLKAKLIWREGWSFDAISDSDSRIVVDGKKKIGLSPMELFLIGLVGCTTVDVVSILEKMRQQFTAIELEVEAEHKQDFPKYFTAIKLNYWVKGKQIEESKLKRAIELSHERYCSALHSLRPDIKIKTEYKITKD